MGYSHFMARSLSSDREIYIESQIRNRNLLDSIESKQRESGVSQHNIIVTCLLVDFFKMSL